MKRYAALPYVESGTNHQKFSEIVNNYGLAGCQNQAWCATYQFALELMAFGKADALSHWCMTAKDYCGYSVFSTRDKFKAKGRTGKTPRLGALVIFSRSHMGRVISIDSAKRTFKCGEGNTSNKEFNRDGDSCAVKTYSWDDPGIDCFCYIEYGDDKPTREKVIKATRAAYEIVHYNHYSYGDSHSVPPCIGDYKVSCDRLIALAFWILGYQDQPAGGFTVAKDRYMGAYLSSYGMKQITTTGKCGAGDVVIYRNNSLIPNAAWHTYLITEYHSPERISKFDCGSQARIDSVQPFINVPMNQWQGQRWFYCAYSFEENNVRDYYEFNPKPVYKGDTGTSAYEASVILKARGYKGVYKDGKQQELELNFMHSVGDMAAASQYVSDRMKQGVVLKTEAGAVNEAVWVDLMGGKLPFKLMELPRCQREGTSVLFWQEQMRARGTTDADDKVLELDRVWRDSYKATVRKYCKAVGLKERDVVDWEVWQSVCGSI
ncbi:MAG: hypothetical protein J6X83_02100 [Methanomicrobium sp.]|nr:hypothetical protein [Methanomicrobium sp.]